MKQARHENHGLTAERRRWLTRSTKGIEILKTAEKIARTSLSVYLEGETGTGKEILARLIHSTSSRSTGPFIPINCGALPIGLAESELFGHKKGAFTGADRNRMGALSSAHTGTLFLDEIGDLPPEIQVKLLRFLEDGEFRPVGSDETHFSDVRLICATHKPLAELIDQSKFRKDLYYRVSSVEIRIPPLRKRPEDISLLACFFANQSGRLITQSALKRLQLRRWEGNVRELRFAVERACGTTPPERRTLQIEDFGFLFENVRSEQNPFDDLQPVTMHEMERRMLLQALHLVDGNRTKAAKSLGVARSTIFEMLKRHGLKGFKARPNREAFERRRA